MDMIDGVVAQVDACRSALYRFDNARHISPLSNEHVTLRMTHKSKHGHDRAHACMMHWLISIKHGSRRATLTLLLLVYYPLRLKRCFLSCSAQPSAI
jgi:hypothetical protein